MDFDKVALYLTLEFASEYSPQTLLKHSTFPEIKLWVDENSCPVFGSGRYSGPKHNSGMLKIDKDSVHIRISQERVMAALNNRNEDDAQANEIHLLFDVCTQIHKQLDCLKANGFEQRMVQLCAQREAEIEALTLEFDIRESDFIKGKPHVH